YLAAGLVRQYSLIGDVSDRARYRFAVRRIAEGRVSSRLHDEVGVGDAITVSSPRNSFPLVDDRRPLAFVAGGIGITPFLPMIQRALADGRDWTLHYGGRHVSAMPFVSELADHGDRVSIHPEDRYGPLPLAAIVADASRRGARVYCCGPSGMIDEVSRLVTDPSLLSVERFRPPAETGGNTIEVELATSGIHVSVASDETILEAVERAGAFVLSSCRTGTCGTCETPVLDGVPDHRDTFLSPAERQSGASILICVSRSRTPRLTLDL
ncbi:PDR/VanB family oxidoreductase, partial [Streptomyces sp. NPDC007162]|uniref:PDR/VanB family oxidoreductase n=1 Tax=Streptomyces sp. NPDC007162 TaxID=3156917 RepID=UPI0033EEFF24